MLRLGWCLLLTGILAVTSTGAATHASPEAREARMLTALWTTVLETPSPQNPFGSGGQAYACIDLGHAVAPFAPTSADVCTVAPGTRIFIVGFSVECSSFEGNGTTDAELRKCARDGDLPAAPVITVDDRPVTVVEVETPLLHITLPADNVFGLPAGTRGVSVGHGWVVLQHPLRPGAHEVHIGDSVVTSIIVEH
jgi:hypothetical protein